VVILPWVMKVPSMRITQTLLRMIGGGAKGKPNR